MKQTFILLAASAMLTACAASQPALSGELGAATAKNKTAQFVPPTQVQKQNTFIPENTELRRAARERYRTGKVTPPVNEGTQ